MRGALGAPLSDVSTTVLNKMVSKDVQASLRKYKMGTGATTPRKRAASRGADECDSPTVRFSDNYGSRRQRGRSTEARDHSMVPLMNNTIRQCLRDLDKGIADK